MPESDGESGLKKAAFGQVYVGVALRCGFTTRRRVRLGIALPAELPKPGGYRVIGDACAGLVASRISCAS